MAQKWHTAPRRPRGPRGALGAAVTQPIWTLGASDNWIAHENANMRTDNLEGTTRGGGRGGTDTWMKYRKYEETKKWEGIGEADKVWSEIIDWGEGCFYLHVNHLFFYSLVGKKSYSIFSICMNFCNFLETWPQHKHMKEHARIMIFLKTPAVKTYSLM